MEEEQKTIFFLGERTVEPVNPVIFENELFFVERTSQCLLIRPRAVRHYLKHTKGTKRLVKFDRCAKEILIPTIADDPMTWFKEKYVENRKRNQQGRFVSNVWKHRNEVFSEVTVG